MFSPWSPGRQSLHIVCVENSNCNYLLRDVCCSQAFVSILFSNILWWSWALSWAYELRECNLPECHWLCRPPPGWIIRWCLITGPHAPGGEESDLWLRGSPSRNVSSWSLLTDNIGRGWLEGLAAVARTGPGLFWLTPDATLAGGQYPGHALSLPDCCRLRGAPGIMVILDSFPVIASLCEIFLWWSEGLQIN